MSSIAARRANKRACQWQPNGMLSRGTHAYPGANGCLPRPIPGLRHSTTLGETIVWRHGLHTPSLSEVAADQQGVHAACRIRSSSTSVSPLMRKENRHALVTRACHRRILLGA